MQRRSPTPREDGEVSEVLVNGELSPVARILRAMRSVASGLERHNGLLARPHVFHLDRAVGISGFEELRL
jgi:hypothetical protein